INSLIQTILENTLDSTADTISDMEDQVDTLEEKIITRKTYPTLFDDLSELMRQLVIMHRFLSPERDALDALTRKETDWFNKNLERSSKDTFNRMQRLIEDIVLLRERVRINQEALNQHDVKKSQKNMYILSVIATVFMPMSFMSGLMGMNVGGIPFADSPHGLAISAALIVIIAGICALSFRKLKWF
ncbi:MAG: CorA family divalent cation transporter, partial [Alphaproteobacteria bacterium]